MTKRYIGAQIRQLREELEISQLELSRTLGISHSYVNQLENDQRPMSSTVMRKFRSQFGLDLHANSTDTHLTLISEMKEIFAQSPFTKDIKISEIDELVSRTPGICETIRSLTSQLTDAHQRLNSTVSDTRAQNHIRQVPRARNIHRDLSDFVHRHCNHFAIIETAAESFFKKNRLSVGHVDSQLESIISSQFGVEVRYRSDINGTVSDCLLNNGSEILTVATSLSREERAFKFANYIAEITCSTLMDSILREETFNHPEASILARKHLIRYFSGAILMPYSQFFKDAERLKYDLLKLSNIYDVGFETICHRMTTLQRSTNRGIPFQLIRIDQAGNISKVLSSTSHPFTRSSGTCPKWIVHDAFSRPNRIHTQTVEMPDGRRYLWIARSVHHGRPNQTTTQRSFVIGLGCELKYAGRTVYSGSPEDPTADRVVVPIGSACQTCPRICAQRAFQSETHRTGEVDVSFSVGSISAARTSLSSPRECQSSADSGLRKRGLG